MLSDDLINLSARCAVLAIRRETLSPAQIEALGQQILDLADRASVMERRPVPADARTAASAGNVVRLADHRRRTC